MKHFADVGKMVGGKILINKSNSSSSLQFFLKIVIKSKTKQKKTKEKIWGLCDLFSGFKPLKKLKIQSEILLCMSTFLFTKAAMRRRGIGMYLPHLCYKHSLMFSVSEIFFPVDP